MLQAMRGVHHDRPPAPGARLWHSPVGVSTAPAAPLSEKRQREQPLDRSLHLVTSALDWQVDVRLRPDGATPETPHGPRRYKQRLGVRTSEVARPGSNPLGETQPLWTAMAWFLRPARAATTYPGLRGTRVPRRLFPSHAGHHQEQTVTGTRSGLA